MNQFYELRFSVLLKQNIPLPTVAKELGRYISYLMYQDDELKVLHKQPTFKNYVYDGLFPIEQERVYKQGRMYAFTLRSFSADFLAKLRRIAPQVEHTTFQTMMTEPREVVYEPIRQLYTVTPFIVTIDEGPWMHDKHDKESLMERLHANVERKLGELTEGKQVSATPFIERIEIINRKPIRFTYKNGITLLGNKARLQIKADDYAQQLAFVAMGAGLGEKSPSLGAGFCLNDK